MASRNDTLPNAHFAHRPLQTPAQFQILHDRAICRACAEDVLSASRRRYRYPFAHCNLCGPRLSVMTQLPFTRAHTTMAGHTPCPACQAEYADPTSRRYGLETISCPKCGPRPRLMRFDGRAVAFEQHFVLDDVDAACSLIQKGEVVAIKGLGGYQLACDATNPAAVIRLRRAKQSMTRPLPLMARDLHVIARYCAISVDEELQLAGPQGPIVILRATGGERIPAEVAPELTTVGFMLPTTALHVLLLQRMSRPVVMTSANLSGEPRIIDDEELREKIGPAITFGLFHDQQIACRVDDSVVRVMAGRPRVLRRARGYAPSPLKLPAGFEAASDPLAVGTDRDTMYGLVRNGEVILSPHYGALREKRDCADYRDAICDYRHLLGYDMSAIAHDPNPRSCASHLAREYASHAKLRLIDVDPQHAHVAACLAENGYPLSAPPALGIVLDRQGWNGPQAAGGGDFLLAGYRDWQRLGAMKPIPMPPEAAVEPWSSLTAHLNAAIGWRDFAKSFRSLELFTYLESRSRAGAGAAAMQRPGRGGVSSCGLLVDAVAAALGVCRHRQTYEGEAAMKLEALVDRTALEENDPERRYPVVIAKPRNTTLPVIDPAAMWQMLLADIARNTPAPIIAARFHCWLASSIVAMARRLAGPEKQAQRFSVVALSGACFENRVLLEETGHYLRQEGFEVLSHALVPPNDSGLALGQAAVGAARILQEQRQPAA
jgi:hydrogenase maturation protein HypF